MRNMTKKDLLEIINEFPDETIIDIVYMGPDQEITKTDTFGLDKDDVNISQNKYNKKWYCEIYFGR